jgi:hypothetical protein
MAGVIYIDIDVYGLTSNFTLERPAGSPSLAAAAHRAR